MTHEGKNLLVVLGPNASGKTRLAVQLARKLGGEIISADSRQVYRGLDIGAGKDLSDYDRDGPRVPHHLIDIADLNQEFSLFDFQQRFYSVFGLLQHKEVLPILAGGTGLYLEAVLLGYPLIEVPEDPKLRKQCEGLSLEDLTQMLRSRQARLHNVTDLRDRGRLIRAIEIATYSEGKTPPSPPPLNPVVLGIRWPPELLHQRIRQRLEERMKNGLIEEVQGLLDRGVSAEKLFTLGLEYRYVTDFLLGKSKGREDLTENLLRAIAQFARRQRSWFRRMERRGIQIHWTEQGDVEKAVQIVDSFEWKPTPKKI